MAHFRGTVTGNRGTASRLGHKKTGLTVTCNGWNEGIKVYADSVDGQDVFTVYKTGGSNGYSTKLIATVKGGAC